MLRYEQLVIEEASTPPVDVTAAGQMLYEKAQEAGLEVWSSSSPELERLLARMEFASIYSESIAPRDLVLRTALRNCAAGLTSFAELRTAVANGGLFSFVLAEIDSRVLDQIAPSHMPCRAAGALVSITPWANRRRYPLVCRISSAFDKHPLWQTDECRSHCVY